MDNTEKVAFLDLVAIHAELENELCDVLLRSLQTAKFVGGPMVEDFELGFSQFCGTRYCIGVSSGTDALRFALMASGVTPGTIVLTVPNTFIATAEAITQAGAVPHFIDVDEDTYNIDVAKLRQFLELECELDDAGERTIHRPSGQSVSAVIPVHLYGQMADMDPICDLADRYKLIVVEDACQAHGAKYYSKRGRCWKTAGSIGRSAAFSFYPGKNLGACGEGGAVTTHASELAEAVRTLRDHGQSKRYHHECEGYNGRLDSIQAGFLRAKLAHLSRWNIQRRDAAAHYNEMLHPYRDLVTLPFEPEWSRAVYHLYVVQVPDRDAVRNRLADLGIETGIHYPIPLHLQKAYSRLGYQHGMFPVAERLAARVLSLPMFPGITLQQQQRVVEALVSAVTEIVKGDTMLAAAEH